MADELDVEDLDMDDCHVCGEHVHPEKQELCFECAATLCTRCFNGPKDGLCTECADEYEE